MELQRLFQALKPQIELALLNLDSLPEQDSSASISVIQFEQAITKGQALVFAYSDDNHMNRPLKSLPAGDLSIDIFLERSPSKTQVDLSNSFNNSYSISFSSLVLETDPFPSGTYSLSMLVCFLPESGKEDEYLCFFQDLSTLELFTSSGVRN
ncbi:MAG: hypothetical protein AAFR87_31045 [Bacteroidota bacterium]